MRFSFIDNKFDTTPKPVSKSWEDLTRVLTGRRSIRDKKDGLAFIPATFREGGKRDDKDVEALTFLVLDVDDGTPVEALRGLWEQEGEPLAAAVWSTHSSTAAKPKWRAVFPLLQPVPASDWARVWRKLCYHLAEGRMDSSCSNESRLYYLPSCPTGAEGEAFASQHEGVLLDPAKWSDPPAGWGVKPAPERREVPEGADVSVPDVPHLVSKALARAELDGRNNTAFWLACQLRDNRYPQEQAEEALRQFTAQTFQTPRDPFTEEEALRALTNAYSSPAREPWRKGEMPLGSPSLIEEKGKGFSERIEQGGLVRLGDFNQTDAGNAERLILRHGEDLRHVPGLGWRVWDGKRWSGDESAVTAYARDTVRALYAEASELLAEAHKEPDREVRKQLAASAEALSRFAIKSESTRALAAMVDQAKSFKEIKAGLEVFVLRPWVIPFQNGVWDRGKWRGHQRKDYIEHLLPVCYDPHADRSEWLALLDRMTGGDAQFAKTLQDVAGYCLSGASTFRVLPWAYGKKGTGKSTFAELLRTALGTGATVVDWSLMDGRREAEKLGAAIRGKRLLVLPEAGNKRLDVEILKSLSGSDGVSCRLLYQSVSFTVEPSWVLVAVSNDPPKPTSAHDDPLRDRVMALPFVHSLEEGEDLVFTGGKRVEEVRRKADSPLVAGFVAWAVEGLARVHQEQEIYRAPKVIEHTRLFWEQTDPLTPFWEELDPTELQKGMGSSALYSAYLNWCNKEGIKRPIPQGRGWGAACKAAGLEQKRVTAGSVWFRPEPSLPLLEPGDHVGMYENPLILESSPKKENIGKVSEIGTDSYIPTLKSNTGGLRSSPTPRPGVSAIPPKIIGPGLPGESDLAVDDLADPFAGTPGGALYVPPALDEIDTSDLSDPFVGEDEVSELHQEGES